MSAPAALLRPSQRTRCLSLSLPLTLPCLLLLAAGVLGTAFPHQCSGKSLTQVGQSGAEGSSLSTRFDTTALAASSRLKAALSPMQLSSPGASMDVGAKASQQ